MSPILIIGTQRSGSNLLRLMLNQIPVIDAPHPPHILNTFIMLEDKYRLVYGAHFFDIMLSDICNFVNANPVPWTGFFAEPIKVKAHCANSQVIDVFKAVYQLKAQQQGAAYWCCKSMSNVYYMPEIEQRGLCPFYIHLFRDARDVAASFKNAIVGEKHVYHIATQWQKEQALAIKYGERYAPNRYLRLKYEDLISNPKRALIPLLEKLHLYWNDDILLYYKSDEAIATASSGTMWKNVIHPVDSGNTKHFTKKLSPYEISIIESVAGREMEALGYELTKLLPLTFLETELAEFESENKLMKEAARAKFNLDSTHRQKQDLILRDIHLKLGIS